MAPPTCFDSFDRLAGDWSRLLSECAMDTVFMTPQWQKVWWRELGNQVPLCLLYFNGDKGVRGLAPLARHDRTLSFVGSQDVCDYNDFLVPRGMEVPFYDALLDYLGGQQWDKLRLFCLRQDSPTLVHLPKAAQGQGYSIDITPEEVSPGVALPATWEEFLGRLSKKDRHELRRKLRRLETAGEVRWYHHSSPEDVERDMDSFFALLKRSRQDKDRFLTTEREKFFRGIGREMALMGVLRLFFLEINGERVASVLCFDYGTSRLLYNSGYNPEYGYYSVGLLIKALSIKSAIEDGKTYFDFLRGHESYKYDLGGQDRHLYTMVVTKP